MDLITLQFTQPAEGYERLWSQIPEDTIISHNETDEPCTIENLFWFDDMPVVARAIEDGYLEKKLYVSPSGRLYYSDHMTCIMLMAKGVFCEEINGDLYGDTKHIMGTAIRAYYLKQMQFMQHIDSIREIRRKTV